MVSTWLTGLGASERGGVRRPREEPRPLSRSSDTQARTEVGRQGQAGAATELSGAGKNEDSTKETLTSGEETECQSARWKMRTGRHQHLLPRAEGAEKKSFRESFKLAANRDKDGTLPEREQNLLAQDKIRKENFSGKNEGSSVAPTKYTGQATKDRTA
jgi:hypothetical protein